MANQHNHGATKSNTFVFITSGIPDENLYDFQWDLSELSRKFPTASFRFKRNGKTSCPYEGLPILDEPVSHEMMDEDD